MYWVLPQKTAWPSGTSVSKGCSCKENPRLRKPGILQNVLRARKNGSAMRDLQFLHPCWMSV